MKKMKATDSVIVAAGHLVAFIIAAALIYSFGVGNPGLALIAAASVGSALAAFLYHRRAAERAAFPVKASAGGLLACMAVLTGVSSQVLLNWMAYPEVVIPISAVGSFLFPWAAFGSMQNACSRKQ